MSFKRSDYRIVVASDVNTRDGIGVEISRGDDLLIEIFRDDTARTREITTFSNLFSLDEMEGFIQIFRDEIPWDFIEDEEVFPPQRQAEQNGGDNSAALRASP